MLVWVAKGCAPCSSSVGLGVLHERIYPVIPDFAGIHEDGCCSVGRLLDALTGMTARFLLDPYR